MLFVDGDKITIEELGDCVVIKFKIPNYTLERKIPKLVLKHVYNERLSECIREFIDYARQNERVRGL